MDLLASLVTFAGFVSVLWVVVGVLACLVVFCCLLEVFYFIYLLNFGCCLDCLWDAL